MAPAVDNSAIKAVAGAHKAFMGNLYAELVKSVGDEDNVVASAFSAGAVLAMLGLGAAGDTAKQIREALSLPDDEKTVLDGYRALLATVKSDKAFTLEAANALFVQQGFELIKDFVAKTAKHFAATSQTVDFGKEEEARGKINAWVEKATHDKIKDLIPKDALDALTRLVLVNAIYFKAKWANQFDEKNTKKSIFQRLKGEASQDVDMMHITDKKFVRHHDLNLNCHVVKMPYAGERLSMYLFLSTSPDGFKAMEGKFKDFDFDDMKDKDQIKLDVTMPRFKLLTSHNLNEPLSNLGMKDMFEEKADFSKLSSKEGLKVSLVLQKAFIEVNEEGTEAAAATGPVLTARMAVVKQEFKLDRPFLFAVRDDLNGIVLFQGRVMDPAKE